MSNSTDAMAEAMLGGSGDSPTGESPNKKRRGRPPGSKNKTTEGKEVKDDSNVKQTGEQPPFVYIPDQTNIAAASKLGSFLWFVAGQFVGCRALTNEEALKLGECIDPLMQKYLPVWADWKYEINAAMVIVGLYQITRIPKEKKSESGAEVVE